MARSLVARSLGRVVAAGGLLAVVWLLFLAPALVRAADVEFGEPSSRSSFGEAIEFEQPVDLAVAASRVEVRLTFADAPGPLVEEVPAPAGTGDQTLRYTFSFGDGGSLLPNTPITVSWRVYTSDDDTRGVDSPPARITYEDDRFDWQTVTGDIVRVHWYEGDAAFGQRALEIGEDAVRETSELLGVTEDDPVDFFIYASQAEFYDALGPGTRDSVGGQANAEIRTLFALITPGEISQPWVAIVVPHELVHLVFDTAVRNPYHFPPRWLNEGLAVILSEGYTASDRQATEAAARDGRLIPLDGLSGQFPTDVDKFRLAYSESASAVDYLIRTHGQDALVALIRSYAEGRTDDEAFRDALGVDVAGFGDAWIANLGAAPPERFGPQPVPAGPQPRGWQGGTGSPGGSGAPAETPAPGGPDAPTAPTDPEPAPSAGLNPLLIVVLLVVLLAAAGLVLRATRRRA